MERSLVQLLYPRCHTGTVLCARALPIHCSQSNEVDAAGVGAVRCGFANDRATSQGCNGLRVCNAMYFLPSALNINVRMSIMRG